MFPCIVWSVYLNTFTRCRATIALTPSLKIKNIYNGQRYFIISAFFIIIITTTDYGMALQLKDSLYVRTYERKAGIKDENPLFK